MISFRKLAYLISPEPWDAFLARMNEEKAQAALEELVNNEEVMERMAREELPWQPYPVAEESSGTIPEQAVLEAPTLEEELAEIANEPY